MYYNYIINPKTNKQFKISSKKGQRLILKYLKFVGGAEKHKMLPQHTVKPKIQKHKIVKPHIVEKPTNQTSNNITTLSLADTIPKEVFCENKLGLVTGLIHRILGYDTYGKLKKMIKSNGLYSKCNVKNYECNSGVYMSLLNTCVWKQIKTNNQSVKGFLGEMVRTDIILIFSKALIYKYDYYINEGWEYGVKTKNTFFKNKYRDYKLPLKNKVVDGVDFFFMRGYDCNKADVKHEIIFNNNIPFTYLQEIWITANKTYEKFKKDTTIPIKFRNMAKLIPKELECKHYNKYCSKKKQIITVKSCLENSQNIINNANHNFYT